MNKTNLVRIICTMSATVPRPSKEYTIISSPDNLTLNKNKKIVKTPELPALKSPPVYLTEANTVARPSSEVRALTRFDYDTYFQSDQEIRQRCYKPVVPAIVSAVAATEQQPEDIKKVKQRLALKNSIF